MRSGARIALSAAARAMPPSASAAPCRVQPPPPRRGRRLVFPQRRPVPPQASFEDTSISSSPAAEKDLDTSHDESSSRGNSNGFLTPVASTSTSNGLRGLDNEDGNEDEEEDGDTADEAAAAADYWSDLLNTPEPDMLGARARSASDAGVLRRKGHLKEQDALIDFMRSMHATHSAAEVMAKLDRWVREHRADPARSRLRRLIPGIGAFFTPLDLTGEFFLLLFGFFFFLSFRGPQKNSFQTSLSSLSLFLSL